LRALIMSEEARRLVLPELADEMIEGFATREIFDALRQAAAAGGTSTFSDLDARLTDSARALLHEVAAADEQSGDEQRLTQAQTCLRVLDAEFRKRQVEQLRTRVKTAEREGRVEEAFGIMAELSRLEREMRGAGGV
jgi:hypothetical protein